MAHGAILRLFFLGSFIKCIVIAGQDPSPGSTRPGGAAGEDRGSVGPAGAAVHQERGRQHEDTGTADHRRSGETHPQEMAVSSSGRVEIPGGHEVGWRC